jgi:PAS domain S-box-containing protein
MRNPGTTTEGSGGIKDGAPKDLSKGRRFDVRLLDEITDGVCTFDLDGRFTFVNGAIAEVAGQPLEWFEDKTYLDLVNDEFRPMVQRLFQDMIQGKSVGPQELSYTSEAGQVLWFEANPSHLMEGDRVAGILVITRDITEKKRTAGELDTYRNQLEALVEKRTAELSVANEQLQHEINEHKKTEAALRDSEDYYKAIFQNTGTAMVIMEEDTTIALVNRESVRFVGLTPEELEGKRRAIEFVAPEHHQMVWGYRTRRLTDASKPPAGYEFTILDRFGKPKDIYMTVALLPRKRKIIASFLDINQRKKMERALQESEEKYRNIFENAVEGVFQISPEGRIMSANPAFARILGYRSPEQVMKTVKNMEYEVYADASRRIELRSTIEKEGSVNNFEIQCRRPDGTRIWISTNVRKVCDEKGRLRFYEGTLVDITERKRMQQDLEMKSETLEETNAALRVLLRHREKDNAELEERVFHNIKELVLPYVERLKTSQSKDGTIVDIIESNLNDILSPFIRGMTAKYANFTPKEIQIADLMKKGKTTKEISQVLNLSVRTIDIHRYHIRRKLNITNKKVNLQSYLLSLSS